MTSVTRGPASASPPGLMSGVIPGGLAAPLLGPATSIEGFMVTSGEPVGCSSEDILLVRAGVVEGEATERGERQTREGWSLGRALAAKRH